jgi:hypothetical protein
MNQLLNNINQLESLANLINENAEFENKKDIRNVTFELLAQTTRHYKTSLILSTQLNNLDYVQKFIHDSYLVTDLQRLTENHEVFLKTAFFINFFVPVENHIRQIIEEYEIRKVDSIQTSFLDLKKIEIIKEKISDEDVKLFKFYCESRNTMHNVGFYSKEDYSITIKDEDSRINVSKVNLCLTKNRVLELTFENMMLLHEQIIKLIQKIDQAIPKDTEIVHKLIAIGFND